MTFLVENNLASKVYLVFIHEKTSKIINNPWHSYEIDDKNENKIQQ